VNLPTMTADLTLLENETGAERGRGVTQNENVDGENVGDDGDEWL
jgi:hypothetical protein